MEKNKKEHLLRLIWQHEMAVKEYKYTQGAVNGKSGKTFVHAGAEQDVLELAREADRAEGELVNFINEM